MGTQSATTISPARRVRGRLQVPGDKSISHRYALLAALADGRSRLTNYSPGADCHSTLACLRRLGVDVSDDHGTVTLLGRGLGELRSTLGPVDAGNSGTTMRLLAGVLAAHPFTTRIEGDASLSRRPMRRVIAPLERMGARIEATDGHAPLVIHGTALHPIAYTPEVASAQLKSAVLLAGLHAEGTTTVHEPAGTRDHTERALREFGVTLAAGSGRIALAGGQRLTAQSLDVPGDFSSAAFWMIAAAAMPDSRLEIENVGLNPTRCGLLDVLRRFGAHVTVSDLTHAASEPRGTIAVEAAGAGSVTIGPSEAPGLIDELPAIAALAASGGEVTVRGAAELRVKESDRIAALVSGFRTLGFDADEFPDGFVVRGAARAVTTVATTVDAHGDHRIAMTFAIAALGRTAPLTITGADAVAISYPGFFEILKRLVA